MTSQPWLSVFLVLDCLFVAGWVWWTARRRFRPKSTVAAEILPLPAAESFEERIAFEAHSSVLSPQARSVLEHVAARLAGESASRVTLEGSADDTGNLTRNRRLSRGRAEAALRFLVARGISPARITVTALEPARGMTELDRQRLRCVTVRGAVL